MRHGHVQAVVADLAKLTKHLKVRAGLRQDAAWLERTAQANSLLLEEILILAGNDTEDYFLLKKEPRQTAGLRQGGAA